ncbi:MAG TPA: trypco2 family protein [Stellaceae bacterium]|nr:trypco2 family protein [Stellaceae bacterium]
MGEIRKEGSAGPILLAEVIRDLRAQLHEALREGANQPMRFQLKPIELELTIGVTTGGDVKTGIKFWVLELGASGKYESAATHKLKLVLAPVDSHGNEFQVTDQMADRPR